MLPESSPEPMRTPSAGGNPPARASRGSLKNASRPTTTFPKPTKQLNNPRASPLAEPTSANTRAGLPGKEGMGNRTGIFVFPCCYC